MDVESIDQLKVAFHEHPLTLSDERTLASLRCRMCFEPISGLTYSCNECVFPVHKWCAELPPKLDLPAKHQHQLTLSFGEENYTEDCSICSIGLACYSAFICLECEYRVHTECGIVSAMDSITFNGLNYSSKVHRFDAEDNCEVCGVFCYGSYLKCVDAAEKCLHIRCALLPYKKMHSCHLHEFTLISMTEIGNPDQNSDELYCDICCSGRERTRYVYYCGECELFGHLSCANIEGYAPISQLLSSPLYADELKESEYYGLLNNMKDLKLRKDEEKKKAFEQAEKEAKKQKVRKIERAKERNEQKAADLEHFLHQHPLELSFNEPINYVVPCNACFYPIYGMTYICKQCDFYLHLACARLPREIQHKIHQEGHHLTFTTDHHYFSCQVCCYFFFGLSYRCGSCKFEVDLQCAYVDENYVKRTHNREHPPFLWRQPRYEPQDLCEYINKNLSAEALFSKGCRDPASPCIACGDPCEGVVFICRSCNFFVHPSCSMLKTDGSHGTHMHSLRLNFFPKEDETDEYYCDACMKKREGKQWVYSCERPGCEFDAHIRCANPMMETIPLTSHS